jgi:anti-sigma-K factor RskA
MSADNHATIRERLPAYALGCLDEAEVGQTARHVDGCPDCAAEWAAYVAVADALALAAPESVPSAGLRGRLLAAVAGERIAAVPAAKISPTRKAAETAAEERIAAVPAAKVSTRKATETAAIRRRWPRRAWPVLAVVALAAIVLGGLLWTAFGLWLAPAVPPVSLSPTDMAPEAAGELVFARGGRAATLTVRGLPVLPAGRQYQLWLVSDGERESGAVFSVNDNGWAETAVEMSRGAAEYERFGITIEPAGGSPGPTGERVLGFARDG